MVSNEAAEGVGELEKMRGPYLIDSELIFDECIYSLFSHKCPHCAYIDHQYPDCTTFADQSAALNLGLRSLKTCLKL